jgi:hypothetical protein
MRIKPSFFFRSYSIQFLMVLIILFLSFSITFAEQVIITPDKIKGTTFHTSDAICYGAYVHTHINLGFGSGILGSVTGTYGQDYKNCTVGGGFLNKARGNESTVGGGSQNNASGVQSTIGGGLSNIASGDRSTVGGGKENTASDFQSTVGGGYSNTASGEYSTVGGGDGNGASGNGSTVGGGRGNVAWGSSSTVGGGDGNIAGGDYSWAGGKNMRLTNTAHHTFVWGFSNTGANPENSISTYDAFLIFPVGNAGKVGIGTDDPRYTLDVDGNIRATGSVYYGGSSGNSNGTAYNKPDFVFQEGYEVMSTEQVAKHLEQENSLPWITSLKQEKEENGPLIDMTRMSFETVETVENLQIQIIELSKLIKALKPKNDALIAENNALREDQRIRFQKQQAEIEELRAMIKELKS